MKTKIAVIGLWHLGSVTAGCLAHLGFNVKAIDDQPEVIDSFRDGKLPVEEPGLTKMINESISKGKLEFSSALVDVAGCSIIWVTYDTPVDDNDHADTEFVLTKVESLFPYLTDKTVVLISSQLPVGSTRRLQKSFNDKYHLKEVHFCYSPENLRLGKAIDVFLNPDRVIVGADSDAARQLLQPALESITRNLLWMNVASAEMTKHAINAFLANSIVFINEIALICERVGADASEVETGLKSEERIGPKAYLKPGNAFAGGTLARDITYLINEENTLGLNASFFNAIFQTNLRHRKWIQLAISQFFASVSGIKISVLGLTYKPGTNTLRRSQAVEFCNWASQNGAVVRAYDPSINYHPDELAQNVEVSSSIGEVLEEPDLIVIATCWPEFRNMVFTGSAKKQVVVIDQNGCLQDKFADKNRFRYIKIGRRNEI